MQKTRPDRFDRAREQAALEVAFAPETLPFNAALALTDTGRVSQVSDGELSMVVRQPGARRRRDRRDEPAVADGRRTRWSPRLSAALTAYRPGRQRPRRRARLWRCAGRVAERSGPQLHGQHLDREGDQRGRGIVLDAIESDAKVVVRGGPVTQGPLAVGSFSRPTLLEVTDSSMAVVQDEIFGPVLTMQTFWTEAEAVAMRGFAVIDDFIEFKHIRLTPGSAARR